MRGSTVLLFLPLLRGVMGAQIKPTRYDSQATFLWSSFSVVCTLRTIFVKFKIPLHHSIFSVMCGFIAPFVVDSLNQREEFSVLETYYMDLLFFYLPGTVFNICFQLDNYVFMKTLSQILVISLPVSLLTGACTGLLFKVVIKPYWPYTHAIMFGVNCAQIFATYTGHYLQRLAIHMKHTSSLLDGEAVISNINCYIVFVMFTSGSIGAMTEWHHFLTSFLRLVLFGFLCGYLFGLLGRFLIRTMYTDHLGVVMVTFAMPYFSFGFTETYFAGCGTITVVIVGFMMSKERTTLSQESDEMITNFWQATEVIVTILICLNTSFSIGIHCLDNEIEYLDWVFTLITYILYGVTRFMSFLLFAPIISRLGYGMNVKSMMICVFGGLKHPLCLLFSALYNRRVKSRKLTEQDRSEFKFHVFGLYFLSYLINGAFIPLLLRVLGVAEVSMAKQINMNNCMKHIFARREKAIAVLKMDRYLADANWGLVNTATAMRHPDKVDSQADDDQENFFMGYRFTYCPDCKKDVAEEPTKKELKEMSREAKMRVLKAMKMSYSRQYENGMVSKEAIRILNQAVELAMDTEEAVIVVDGLHRRFNKEGRFKRFVRKRVHELSEMKKLEIKGPRTYWRRLCYHLVKTKYFDHFIYFMNFSNVVILIADVSLSLRELVEHLRTGESKDLVTWEDHMFTSFEFFFFVIYLFEFVVRMMAYSRNGFSNAFRVYFSLIWNKLDFFVLLVYFVDLSVESCSLLGLVSHNDIHLWRFHICMDFLKLTRVLKLFQIFKYYYPVLLRYLDTSVDANMAFTYELGKAYVSGVEEVSKMIHQIVDHEKIKEEVKQRLEQDRMLITKLLGTVQKERPWIAITVKTKQAIRTVNNSMKEAIMQLKTSGWTDQMEHEKLMRSLAEVYKHVNSIKSVQPSAPEVIFKEVAWMAGDDAVFDFLFENVTLKKYEPGEVVFGEGMVADGVYIVVTGMFLMTYNPDPSFLNSWKEYGQLPIADYVQSSDYENSVADYIVSGNCMGELSTLTGRAYNCTITADSHSQVYVLSNNVIRRAMELSSDPINGLECRIWKAISIRLAVPILMAVPTFQSYSLDQIKYTLERAFVPDMVNYKIFTVTEMIQDIILIEGMAADFHTRELFVAPCYVPRTVQKLILPNSSLMTVPINIDIKMLIIPEKEVDEIDVMLMAEETCELIPQDSSVKCLQHLVQNRSSRLKRRNRVKGMISADSSNMKRRKYRNMGRESSSRSITSNPSKQSEEMSLYLSEVTSAPSFDPFDEELKSVKSYTSEKKT